MIYTRMRLTLIQYLPVLILPLILSGCGIDLGAMLSQRAETEVDQPQVTLDQVRGGEHVIAVVNGDQVLLVDVDHPEPVLAYQLKPEETLGVFSLFDIKVSPDNSHLVWYSPVSGLISLNLDSSTTKIIRPANAWLSAYPYFDFSATPDVVHLVDDDGTVFYTINYKTGVTTTSPIPFPFGTTFKISPDQSIILFISAYGQTESKPEFMFTNRQGENPIRFDTPTLLNQRHMAEWLNNSSGVVMVGGDERSLISIRANSNVITEYFRLEGEAKIISLHKVDDLLYLETSEGKWHMVDGLTGKEVGRVPKEIAAEIHRPLFVPWHNRTFLIEETLRIDQEQFKRLWFSNHLGVKKSVIKRYDEVTFTTPDLAI